MKGDLIMNGFCGEELILKRFRLRLIYFFHIYCLKSSFCRVVCLFNQVRAVSYRVVVCLIKACRVMSCRVFNVIRKIEFRKHSSIK